MHSIGKVEKAHCSTSKKDKVLNLIVKIYMFLSNKILGIQENKVVLSSYAGKAYSDNPKVISEKLHEEDPNLEIVWVFNKVDEKKDIVPSYVRCVENRALITARELATAKVWISNVNMPYYLYKSKRQLYIQTWHADRGFKKILYDSAFAAKDLKIMESKKCDLMLSGSEFSVDEFHSAFRYYGEILPYGCPRNDILLNHNQETINKIKEVLHIEQTTNILLYAPTFRKEVQNGKQKLGDIDLLEILNCLESKTGKKWIGLVRGHSSVRGLCGIPQDEKIMDVSKYEDMSDLLVVSDMLITDYSSSVCDFALLNRPIFLFQSDRDNYLETNREFYFDIDQSPFMIALNQAELINKIIALDWDKVPDNCKEILEFYGTHETGEATKRVVEYILKKISA